MVTFYDSGGPLGDYMDNQSTIMPSGGSIVTIYPSTVGAKVSVTFNSFNTETHYHDLSNYSQIDDDILYVYNGNSTSSVQVGALQGQAGYGTITSSAADGSLTFKFVSHSPYYTATSGTRSGWSATLACNYTPTDISMIASGSFTTCGGNFYDSGGPLGDYMDNQSTIMPSGGTIVTIYPSTVGAKVSVTFNSFNTETHYHDLSNYSQIDDDILYVYNGNSTSSVQVGALQGQAGYGTITSSAADGSLTFKFVSHSPYYTATSGTRSGWSATLACNYTPTDISMIASGSFTTCGGNFYDSGGPLGDYMDNQSTIIPSGGTIITFYPDYSNKKIDVAFSSLSTQTQYHDFNNYSQIDDDKLYIYNGSSIASPIIATLSGVLNPGSFTSTAVDGSMTFKFVSYAPFNTAPIGLRAGWSAFISCSPISTNDIIKDNPKIQIFPNPVNEFINLSCVNLPEENYKIILTDLLGRKLYEVKSQSINGSFDIQINIGDFSKGIYFLSVSSTNTKLKTVKIQK
ncbi:MAG: T9SS type A sorting domain-containing protein [Bacteroidetes bacterium]|nr:T9SS type A sorting domain-containing protein [Bacteroidota bacterium]